MNLHSIVRPAINTVNPEILGLWRQSTGYTKDPATGRPVPNYTEYRYAVVNDRRVIVEPRTRKVIKIID